MVLKTFKQVLLLLSLSVLHFPSNSMRNNTEIPSQSGISLEALPNEVLLLIFQQRIQDIVTTYDSTKANVEFKLFLQSLRLTNKRFYRFTEELKRYFITLKKPEGKSQSPRKVNWTKSDNPFTKTVEMLKPKSSSP